MPLHLNHRDPVALVSNDDVHLPIAPAGETNVWDHNPSIGEAISQRLDHDPLLGIGEPWTNYSFHILIQLYWNYFKLHNQTYEYKY